MNKENIERRKRQKQKMESTKKNKIVTLREEYLNCAQSRSLIKDKNSSKETLKIITKYFPDLIHLFSTLTDNGIIIYNL